MLLPMTITALIAANACPDMKLTPYLLDPLLRLAHQELHVHLFVETILLMKVKNARCLEIVLMMMMQELIMTLTQTSTVQPHAAAKKDGKSTQLLID